ncbi:hypothetical protein [Bacillus testis]|uniref:hypothetical protein n=1 Tax=Bacillus testis TaxID=1622072 RepID=UPI00067F64C5|nr:hypothetical protein [Bacillus testis]
MTIIDLTFPKQFCSVSQEGEAELLEEVPASVLLDDQATASLMDRVSDAYEATNKLLPASVLGLSLFGLCGTQLYVLARYNSLLSLSLDRLTLQIALYNRQIPYMAFKMNNLALEASFSKTDILDQLTASVINPVGRISRLAGVKSSLIYNQYGARMSMLEQSFLQQENLQAYANQFIDYLQWYKQIPGTYFQGGINPFIHTPVYISHPFVEGEQMMLRSACCMYHCRKGGQKCYNCPALTAAARQKIREEMHQS